MVIYAPAPDSSASTERAVDLHDRLGLSKDVRLIGFVGRIAYVKGLDLLAQAAKKVVAADPNTHFVIIGEALFNEMAYKETLIGLIDHLALGDHWHMTGYLQQVSALIAQMDVLVLPSRREALPLVLLEAAKVCTPVVASRVGGIPEVVLDGETGRLVSVGDVEGLARALLELLGDDALRRQFGENSERHVAEYFNQDRYFGDFVALYHRLARRSNGS